jgi:hypothetical protein
MSLSKPRQRFRSYTQGEGRTGAGQPLRFSCSPDDVAEVKGLLQKIRTIEFPETHKMVSHGGLGSYSRYDIKQYLYGGGNDEGCGGYGEVLVINNPPDGYHPIVWHEYMYPDYGHHFTEWDTLEHAKAAKKSRHSMRYDCEEVAKLPGFIRMVMCGPLTPWFYAIADEELVGDYALPEGLSDDPVYRLGQKFVVKDMFGNLSIKTCMGTRYFEQEAQSATWQSFEVKGGPHRIVYWNDGSCWRDENMILTRNEPPRPLAQEELWITDALTQFQELLAGQRTNFTINFADQSKFVGRVIQPKSRQFTAAGVYTVRCTLDGADAKEGKVDFKPTAKYPDLISCVTANAAVQWKHKLVKVEVLKSSLDTKGKRWRGVFYIPRVKESPD